MVVVELGFSPVHQNQRPPVTEIWRKLVAERGRGWRLLDPTNQKIGGGGKAVLRNPDQIDFSIKFAETETDCITYSGVTL